MARPKEFEEGSRIHVGIMYNRYLVALFDKIVKRQGYDRTQAIEICMKDVVQKGRVPDNYFPEVDVKMDEERRHQEALPGADAPHPKDNTRLPKGNTKLFTGNRTGKLPVKKVTKLTQTL